MEEFRSAMVPPGSEQHLGLSMCHLGLWPQAGPQVAAHLPPPHPNIHSQHPETIYLLCPCLFWGSDYPLSLGVLPQTLPDTPELEGWGKALWLQLSLSLSAPPLSTHSGFEEVVQAH